MNLTVYLCVLNPTFRRFKELQLFFGYKICFYSWSEWEKTQLELGALKANQAVLYWSPTCPLEHLQCEPLSKNKNQTKYEDFDCILYFFC